MSNELLVVLLVLAGSVWFGGYVAIAVVARAAAISLDPSHRVAFFRSLGRLYLGIGAPALVVTLASGLVLLSRRGWDALAVAAVIVAAAIVGVLVVAVVQARRMSKLRQLLITDPDDARLAARVRGGGRLAGILRAGLGVLSFALVVMACLLAV